MKPKNGVAVFVVVAALVFAVKAALGAPFSAPNNCRNLEFSPSFLGTFKKSLRFEARLVELSQKYDIDFEAILAVMMYESGGNENLTSSAGAKGLLQLMPGTKKWIQSKFGIKDHL